MLLSVQPLQFHHKISCSKSVVPLNPLHNFKHWCLVQWYSRAISWCVYRPCVCSRDNGGRGWRPHKDSTLLRSFKSRSWIRMTGSSSRRLLLPAAHAPAPLLLLLRAEAATHRCKEGALEPPPPAEDARRQRFIWFSLIPTKLFPTFSQRGVEKKDV